jgi:ABC-type phosphate transport system substrate-binding protein
LLSIWTIGVLASEQKITIKGSNTFGEELAPALIEQFQKNYPDVKVELEFEWKRKWNCGHFGWSVRHCEFIPSFNRGRTATGEVPRDCAERFDSCPEAAGCGIARRRI